MKFGKRASGHLYAASEHQLEGIQQTHTSNEKCSVEEFAVYFLNFIRTQTEDFGEDNLNASIPFSENSLDLQNDGFKPLKFCSTPTRSNYAHMQSTPYRNHSTTDDCSYSRSITGQNSFDRSANSTFSPAHLHSSEKNSYRQKLNSSPICLSDFMSPATSKVRNRKNTRDKSENSSILSENDFPAIGKRTPKSNQKASTSSTSAIESPKDCATPIRPRKRVAPITVKSTPQNNFGSIAYRAENNLLDINNDETKISRDLLKNVDVIAKEFESENHADMTIHFYGQLKRQNASSTSIKIDLTKATQVDVLKRMISIYTIIIDSNLTTNCLTEISFLLNLLNAEFTDAHQPQPQLSLCEDSSIEPLDEQVDELIEPHLINRQCSVVSSSWIFKNIHNCVYFSAGVLSKQKHLLMLLDITTIKVLMDNERLMEHGECMREFLTNVYAHKLQLDSVKCSNHDVSFKQGGGHNVFYQEDDDTKEHFPSMREFSAFKNQRDGFYSVLRVWESNHFNPSWNFVGELGPKIKSLFGIMRHPINMAHLAKLFTSQLILSSNFEDTSSDLQQTLQIDPTKLSKLQQRLIAPSYFATDYMYPGSQAFFRDFLKVAETEIIFIEQLKIVLINELLELNGSSYETINLSSGRNKITQFDEYVVRPETVAIMRVLAKFLGLIYVKPFAYDGTRNFGVDSRQIEQRNMTCPIFDIKGVLSKSIKSNRLIVTIPWLVQFLSMLDYITLRLSYFVDIFHMLYDIYNRSTETESNETENRMRPTSLFIIRTCLGWLFEQSNIPDEYHKYRQTLSMAKKDEDMAIVQVLPSQFKQSINCGQSTEKRILATLDPMMENILNAACPFLRDFRVSIMPAKYSKTVSRSGKYRHITTQKASETKTSRDTHDQTKLAEAFLQSQSLSVRRTIEFVIERTVSAVIKDFQIEILVPMKREVNEGLTTIIETDKRKVANEMFERFTNAQQQLNKKWDECVPQMTRERVKKAFDALLPNETLSIVKQTCTNLAVEKCKLKANEWKNMNLVGIEFFTKDLSGDAYKLIKNRTALGKQPNVLSFDLGSVKKFASNLLGQIQIELHYASMRPERSNSINIQMVIDDIAELLTCGVLPSPICKTICFSTLHLVLSLVYSRPDLLQPELLDAFTRLWDCNLLEYWTKPNGEMDGADGDDSEERDNLPNICPTKSRHIFSNLISNCLMHRLIACPFNSFEALERLLVILIEKSFVTIASLNEQFVSVLREEWPEDLLKSMSSLISKVASRSADISVDKVECLFMEMLQDLF
ncbi:hypothetical protein HA402_009439 [Bradysia odoriphaga]|nr:hypothetical protein HA402_009439 [Bradysia odoriphaga]